MSVKYPIYGITTIASSATGISQLQAVDVGGYNNLSVNPVSGNVLIGSATAVTNAKLEVTGTGSFTGAVATGALTATSVSTTSGTTTTSMGLLYSGVGGANVLIRLQDDSGGANLNHWQIGTRAVGNMLSFADVNANAIRLSIDSTGAISMPGTVATGALTATGAGLATRTAYMTALFGERPAADGVSSIVLTADNSDFGYINYSAAAKFSLSQNLAVAGAISATGNISSATAFLLGSGASAAESPMHVRIAGADNGVLNGLSLISLAKADNTTGLTIGYRTDETTAYLAPRTGTGNLAFMYYTGAAWAEGFRMATGTGAISMPGAVATGALTVAGGISATTTITATTGFGCNSKTAQTAYASGGALSAYGAGANGFDSGANASALHAMVVSIRAALVANGIMS